MRTLETSHAIDELPNKSIVRTETGKVLELFDDGSTPAFWNVLHPRESWPYQTVKAPVTLLWPTESEPNEKLVTEHIEMVQRLNNAQDEIRMLRQKLDDARKELRQTREKLARCRDHAYPYIPAPSHTK